MKITRTHFLLVFLTVTNFTIAQKNKQVEGKFQMKMEANFTLELAKQKACDFARVQAMEDEFGRVVFQSNSTMIENMQNGQKVETKSVFNMLADTYVNAEWIEDSKPSVVTKDLVKGEIWLTCKVEGKARELSREKVELQVDPLNCKEKKCKTTEFKSGADFYINFKSPKNGYVVLFLDDKSTAFCIFPYQEMPFEEFINFKFLAQKDYLFFAPQLKFKENWNFVDELKMETDNTLEKNRLFVLFSENPINIPLLKEKVKEVSGTYLPRSLPSEDFQKWIQKMRVKDEKMQLEIIDITINR